MAESWKPVVGYEGRYEVSDLGRVRSTRTLRRPTLNTHGYRQVNLSKGGWKRVHSVHVLVLAAFVGPRPDGMVTRHLDGNRENNTVWNLAYGTPSQNMFDRRTHGTDRNASKTHCPRGHTYDAENTYIRPDRPQSRECRACNRSAVAAYKARKRVRAA